MWQGSGKKDKLADKWRPQHSVLEEANHEAGLTRRTQEKRKAEAGVWGQGSTVGYRALVRMRSASKARWERGRRRGTRANPHTSKMPGLRSQRREILEENKPPPPRSALRNCHPYDGIGINQIYVFGLVFSFSYRSFSYPFFFLSSAQISLLSKTAGSQDSQKVARKKSPIT